MNLLNINSLEENNRNYYNYSLTGKLFVYVPYGVVSGAISGYIYTVSIKAYILSPCYQKGMLQGAEIVIHVNKITLGGAILGAAIGAATGLISGAIYLIDELINESYGLLSGIDSDLIEES